MILFELEWGWRNLHSWNKRTISRQQSAVEGLVHVDDGIETENTAKKLNGQKVLLASMSLTRPFKNNQKYGVRAEDSRFVNLVRETPPTSHSLP
jgi:hypothetical protein